MNPPAACPDCGAHVPGALLACHACGRLLHAEELKRLAAEAEAAHAAGDPATALARWRSALALLPPSSRQYVEVSRRLSALSATVAAAPQPSRPPTPEPQWVKRLGPLGAVALLLWKFKFVLAALLSKWKFFLFGLTKASTFFTMLASFGLYWTLYGWKFGLGFVLSIYVHEMGHVAALRRFGIPATAPMFIPGLGALVRLKTHPHTTVEDATVGLAGPLSGLVAALVCWGLWWLGGGGNSTWGALAHAGAWINLFNLLPVWQLDGARGLAALSRRQRVIIAAAFVLAWSLTSEGLLALLSLAAAVRCLGKDAPEVGDRRTLMHFLFLIATLSFLVAQPLLGAAPQSGLGTAPAGP